jgi:hypothetical protein
MWVSKSESAGRWESIEGGVSQSPEEQETEPREAEGQAIGCAPKIVFFLEVEAGKRF